MPNKALEKWAKESGKTLKEAEDIWTECEEVASKKFKEKNDRFYSYVNVCVRAKLGLLKESKESLGVLNNW